MNEDVSKWEKAEVERSIVDAQRKRGDLRASPELVARYMQPPASTSSSLEYAFHLLGDVRGKTVLDYGCGDGRNAILLAHRGARVVGIDISPELIDVARKRLAANGLEAEFRVGSALDTGLPDASIDAAFAVAIFHHLDLDAAHRELSRILKPGGALILQEPVRDSKLVWALRRMIPYKHPYASPFERPLTIAELVRIAQGFTRTHFRRFGLPFTAPLKWAPASLKKLGTRLDGLVLRLCPWTERYAGVAVMRLEKPFK